MREKPPLENPPVETNPETDFGSVFDEVNAEKDRLELRYENFVDLARKEKLNVFSALLDFEKGQIKPLAVIYKAHPELKGLLDEEVASRSLETRKDFFKRHPEDDKLSAVDLVRKIKEEVLMERQELLNRYKKEVIGIIYQNLISLKNNGSLQPGNLSLLLDNGPDFLQLFQVLKEQQAGQGKDLFPVLEEYLSIKSEGEQTDNPEKVAMYLFFDLKNEPLEILISDLEKLSAKFSKDVISNLVSRLEDERRLTELSRKTEPIKQIVEVYGHANDQLHHLLNNFSGFSEFYESKGKEVPESLVSLKELVDVVLINELNQISKVQDVEGFTALLEKIKDAKERSEAQKKIRRLEADIVDMGEYNNYRKMRPEELAHLKNEYEKILKVPVKQLVDIKILSSLGELIEKRVNYFHDVLGPHAELSKKYRTEYDWH